MRKIGCVLTVIALFLGLTACAETPVPPITLSAVYQNPLIDETTEHAWSHYGVGDPFVMRWNGRYYLYSSTKDGEVGISCWISEDLVSWTYGGICAPEALTMSAYAPEVVYHNGSFYMYTSPSGNGHYVLKSDSPTGPFTAVTDNFGLSIDGHVFIDDDGKWYFYTAGVKGIVCYRMTAPDRVDPTPIQTAAYMNGWTEGPMVIRYNGRYYMTYCGNHVWSDGYRIDYGTSTLSPYSVRPAANHPLLLSTKETFKGIGHSSTVLSPSLDSYYIVYHSYETEPKRRMNIDRLVLNGAQMSVLGPTDTPQEAPQKPIVSSYFDTEDCLNGWTATDAAVTDGRLVVADGGRVLSKTALSDDFTTECHFLSTADRAAFLFSYTDEQNGGRVIFDPAAQQLQVELIENGVFRSKNLPLVLSFDTPYAADVPHKLTLRKTKDTLTVLWNDRTVGTLQTTLGGGKIGMTATGDLATFGFVGGSNEVAQSSLKTAYKPIDGAIPAITCTEKVSTVFHDEVGYVAAQNGETYTYRIHVAESGSYDLSVAYRAETETVLSVSQNGRYLTRLTLPPAADRDRVAFTRALTLSAGAGNLTVQVESGTADLLSITLDTAAQTTDLSLDFEQEDGATPLYQDGSWQKKSGQYALLSKYGKCVFGQSDAADYTVEATVKAIDADSYGLLFRVTDPTTHSPSRLSEGVNYLNGYSVRLENGKLVLAKHRYDLTVVAGVPFRAPANTAVRLRVEAVGSRYRIWADDALLIDYTDPSPLLQGAVGFFANNGMVIADDLTLTKK